DMSPQPFTGSPECPWRGSHATLRRDPYLGYRCRQVKGGAPAGSWQGTALRDVVVRGVAVTGQESKCRSPWRVGRAKRGSSQGGGDTRMARSARQQQGERRLASPSADAGARLTLTAASLRPDGLRRLGVWFAVALPEAIIGPLIRSLEASASV